MNKMYFVSYETAKDVLNLAPQNEAQDRINLAFCNQLVKDALEDISASADQKQKYLEAIVLKVYDKYKSYEECNEKQLVGMYSAIKDTLTWI